MAVAPLLWIAATAFKSQSDAIAYPPKVIFQPTLEGYVNLFTVRTRQTPDFIASLPPATTWYDKLVRKRNMVIAGPSKVVPRFMNSLVIGFGSTFLAVLLGTLAAYAFSRFRIPLADDLLFFILSTRMMPPVAVAIPIYLMYRQLNLTDTKIGMILLYTAVNVSLAVWLLKGFIDEIPREYEEAALIDGYTRLQALRKVVLPQAVTGIAATAIFCLIFSWNEYAFAVLLTSGDAQTMPPFIPFIIGEGGQDWPAVAAATTLFVIPIVLFTVLLRVTCCAASPSGRCANERERKRDRRCRGCSLVPPRTMGRGGDDAHCRRHRNAGATVVNRALRLFVRDHSRRHAWFCRREPFSGLGGRTWYRSASKICARPSISLRPSTTQISRSKAGPSLPCSALPAAARRRRCA